MVSALVVATMVTTALGHTVAKGDVEIIHAWAEPSSGPGALAHPTVSNEGTEDITLLRVETPVASRVRLLRGGKEIAHIVIPPEDIISFDGDPYSIELQGLVEPLIEGGQFPVTFYFSGELTIEMKMVVGESTMMQEMDEASSTGTPASRQTAIILLTSVRAPLP